MKRYFTQLSWITNHQFLRKYTNSNRINGERQMIIRLNARDQLSRRNTNVPPRLWIEPATRRLQIRYPTYSGNRADNVALSQTHSK